MMDLRWCPFCGGPAELIKPFNSNYYKYVVCKKCEATGPKSVNERYAIKWWNRRMVPPPLNVEEYYKE